MKPILEQLQTLAANYATLYNFVRAHGDKLDDHCWFEDPTRRPLIYLRDAASVGEAFGTAGWTRHSNYNGTFDWDKTVDGVILRIKNAEDPGLDGSAVPPKTFPLALQSNTTE